MAKLKTVVVAFVVTVAAAFASSKLTGADPKPGDCTKPTTLTPHYCKSKGLCLPTNTCLNAENRCAGTPSPCNPSPCHFAAFSETTTTGDCTAPWFGTYSCDECEWLWCAKGNAYNHRDINGQCQVIRCDLLLGYAAACKP